MLRLIAVRLVAPTVLLAATMCQTTWGADVAWPGWRGPKRDGWVSGFRPPDRWPDQLSRVWQTEVGTGYASPVVAESRAYVHARQGAEEVVWCLDLDRGTVHWRKSYAAPFQVGSGAQRHGKGPKSSPALSAGRLFTLSITGVLSAWDAESGKLLWRRDYDGEFGKSHPYWGAATSPLIEGERVIVHFGSDEQGALIGLDVDTGKEVWRAGSDAPSYASPILVELEGTRQIIELTQKALVSVESDSGRVLWEYAYPQIGTDQNMVTPAYHQGLLLVGGENRGVLGLEIQLDDEAWTVQQRWFQEKVALDMSSAIVNENRLYGFSHYDSGRLFCLDIETGDVLWQGPGRAGDNAMLLSIPGFVVALMDNGELLVISAGGERYEQVASYRVSESSTWAPPVLLESGILVKDERSLARWSFTVPSSNRLSSSP